MIFICIMFKFLAKRNNLPDATAKFILFNIYFKTPDALGFQGDAYLKYLSIIFWLEISTQIHFSNQSNPGVPKTANLVFPLRSANSGLHLFFETLSISLLAVGIRQTQKSPWLALRALGATLSLPHRFNQSLSPMRILTGSRFFSNILKNIMERK